jgi:hypothetical protein
MIGTFKKYILLCTTLCTILLGTNLLAGTSTQFGFFLEPIIAPDQEETIYQEQEYKALNAYFIKLDNKLSNGIRFGVDKLINIRFNSEKIMLTEPKCHLLKTLNEQSDFQYIDILDDNTLMIHQDLRNEILNHSIRKKIGNCSHQELLIKELEIALLKLPNAEDLQKSFSKSEKKIINACHEARRRGYMRALKFKPILKAKCKAVDKLLRKRVALKKYEKSVRSLLYNTKVEFDATSFTDTKLQRYNICKTDYVPTKILKSGKKIKMLGMAIVYMAPGFTTSVAGHVAERYIYCLDNNLKDIMFEYTQLTAYELDDVKYVYQKQVQGASDKYLKGLVDSIYIKVKHDVSNNEVNGYGFVQFHTNRDVLEVWPKFDQTEMYDGLQTSLKKYKKQKQNIIDRVDFEEYSLLHNNCTHAVRERMKKYSGGELKIDAVNGLTPIWIFNFLKNKNVHKIIVYPSQRLLRKYQMLEAGKSLFWENTTFWSKASKGAKNGSMLMLYPDSHGFLKGLLTKPLYGLFNLTAGALQATIGIIKTPLKWLSKLPAFKWIGPKNDPVNSVAQGFQAIGMSLTEMVGIRLRYPSPTDWTDSEREYLFKELPSHEPKIVDFLFDAVSKK